MNIPLNSPSRLWLLPAAVIGLVLVAGCNKSASTQTPQSVGPTAPPAAPGSSLTQNNPPPGQPNHLTPEMQAQIERYRALGANNGAAGKK